MHIVLYEPEIPQNAGNVVRTCAVTGAPLHIIRPMGFEWDDAKLKRAGLDYWHHMDIRFYDGWDDFLSRTDKPVIWIITTRGKQLYTDAAFGRDDYLVFGRETSGLPERLHNEHPALRVPMKEGLRSLNLSNTVALVLYEALRQGHFEGLV